MASRGIVRIKAGGIEHSTPCLTSRAFIPPCNRRRLCVRSIALGPGPTAVGGTLAIHFFVRATGRLSTPYSCPLLGTIRARKHKPLIQKTICGISDRVRVDAPLRHAPPMGTRRATAPKSGTASVPDTACSESQIAAVFRLSSGGSSVGRARPSHGRGREFESRPPLHFLNFGSARGQPSGVRERARCCLGHGLGARL